VIVVVFVIVIVAAGVVKFFLSLIDSKKVYSVLDTFFPLRFGFQRELRELVRFRELTNLLQPLKTENRWRV